MGFRERLTEKERCVLPTAKSYNKRQFLHSVFPSSVSLNMNRLDMLVRLGQSRPTTIRIRALGAIWGRIYNPKDGHLVSHNDWLWLCVIAMR